MTTQQVTIDFDKAEHTYESRVEGEWMVFTCPKCPGHERRLNWQTGKMTAKGTDWTVTHAGVHVGGKRSMN